MAEIEESMENVDNPFASHHFSDSDPPSPEQLLAMLEKLSGLSNVDRKEVLQELFKRKLLTEREPVEPVQQLLTSQFLVFLALLFIIATIFGKKFGIVINARFTFMVMTLISTSCNLVFTD
jgi:hypothetical protein